MWNAYAPQKHKGFKKALILEVKTPPHETTVSVNDVDGDFDKVENESSGCDGSTGIKVVESVLTEEPVKVHVLENKHVVNPKRFCKNQFLS